MSETQLEDRLLREESQPNPDRKKGIAATGSVVGAVLASSCCIGPLVLITIGASGAWIGTLTALKAYQPYFVAIAVAFIGYGFWRVYGQSKQVCDDESCARLRSDNVVKITLWTATGLVIVALTADLWAPLFY